MGDSTGERVRGGCVGAVLGGFLGICLGAALGAILEAATGPHLISGLGPTLVAGLVAPLGAILGAIVGASRAGAGLDKAIRRYAEQHHAGSEKESENAGFQVADPPKGPDVHAGPAEPPEVELARLRKRVEELEERTRADAAQRRDSPT